jgi:flagellin
MVINTNIQAQDTARNLNVSQTKLSKSLARLSSGSKLTDPGDDAGGMAVGYRLGAQAKRLSAANYNVQNAVSLIQTQHGYIQRVASALDRMSELTIMAQDVTKTDSDRSLYQTEFSQLQNYIVTTYNKDFNGVSLFSSNTLGVTIDSEGTLFSMSGVSLGSSTYTAAMNSSITSVALAISALAAIKDTISQLASDRAIMGANQTRLNLTAEQLQVTKENLSAAKSRIEDVDVADESTEFARYNILVQAGTAMLSQANSMPQAALKLLQ